MSKGIPITQAAKRLRKSPSTVRRWIQKGAPTVRLGEVGRNKGSLVNIEDIQRWRGGVADVSHEERLQFIATVLMDSFKRDEITIKTGITIRELAGVLALVYERYHKNLTCSPVNPDSLPDEIKQLCAIYVS